jgi:Ca-activated chloride channel homolog
MNAPQRRPDDPRLLYNAGTAAYQAQDYTNAIRVLGKATTAPDLELQQRALFNLGDALYRRGEQVPDRQSREDLWRQAVQNFEAALKLNPQDADAEFNRNSWSENRGVERAGTAAAGFESSGQSEQQPQPQPAEQPNPPAPSPAQAPSEPQSTEPQPGEIPPRGEMTMQEAQQMLDAARQEERPLIFQPSDKERKRQNRVFKDW